VDVLWISVRVGRAPFCEVRLAAHELADEVCRLYRRGQAWHLVPVNSQGVVSFEGKRVERSCPLPFDVPFFVGTHRLTLRKDRAIEPDWGMVRAPVPPESHRVITVDHASEPTETSAPRGPSVAVEQIVQSTQRLAEAASVTRDALESSRGFGRAATRSNEWVARWQAAGAEVKARPDRAFAAGEPKRPVYQPGFEPVPIREPRIPTAPPVITPPAAPRTAAQSGVGWPAPAPEPDRARPPAAAPPANRPEEPSGTTVAQDVCLGADFVDEGPRDHVALLTPDPSFEGGEGEPEGPASGLLSAPLAAQPALPVESVPVPDPAAVSARSIDDEPARNSSSGRRREAGARKTVAARPRAGDRSRTMDSNRQNAPVPESRVEWPSAREILAAHQAIPRPGPMAAARPAGRVQVSPTEARAPEQWNAPAWLAGPPAVVFICLVGLTSLTLSWRWASDSYAASILTDRLMLAGQSAQRRPLPESVVPPAGSWTGSTAQHLAHWAVFLNHNGAYDPALRGEIKTLLERALEAAPVNPTARLALAQLEPPVAGRALSVRSLGLSRDAVSLSHSAGRLLAAGQRDAAVRLYSQALSIAASGERSRGSVPGFDRDPAIQRYLLPGEERVRDVARALVSATDWSFADWSIALPRDSTSRVAVARLMRERGRAEAENLLDLVLREPPGDAGEAGSGARGLAARAEALALRSRWQEAAEQYRQAIELADDDTSRRSWWFNLAEVADRKGDQTQRDLALRAALASGPSDDISRRAADLQRTSSASPLVRSTGAKAN
jgi:tetratricopeptide (TPR) repeat protein